MMRARRIRKSKEKRGGATKEKQSGVERMKRIRLKNGEDLSSEYEVMICI